MKQKTKKLILMMVVLAGALLGAWKYLPATDFQAQANESRLFDVLEPESWVAVSCLSLIILIPDIY